MTNVEAVETTISALDAAGRLADTDAALVALNRYLAAAVDADRCAKCGATGGTAALWREYRAAVQSLSEVGADDLDDDTTAFRVSVQVPRRASLGHSENT